MQTNLKFIWTSDLNSQEYRDLKKLRIAVFVTELHGDMPTEIHDEDKCKYLTVYEQDQCIAGARLLQLNPETVRIQRVVVKHNYRNNGIGHKLLSELESACLNTDCKKIEIAARYTASDFYQALGYQPEGDTFIRSGVPHQLLFKNTIN